MRRLFLLLLVVAVIVALLAWVTNQNMVSQAAPLPGGPGEIAGHYRVTIPEANVVPLSLVTVSPA